MQLKKIKPIRGSLMAATCTLLGTALPAVAADDSSPWEIDSAVLYYTEQDRVSAVEPVIRVRKEFRDEEFFTARIALDSLTGSSANGAVPSSSVQTFTTPSGKAYYTSNPNETPLDATFQDTRVGINLEWERPLFYDFSGIFSGNVSKEYDYRSMGLAAMFSRDFNLKNTTVTAGLSFSHDTIEPEGGIPAGMTAMPTDIAVSKQLAGGDDTKTLVDFLVGLTQVLSPQALIQLNYSYGNSSGYHTDPYKLVSVVDDQGEPTSHLYEQRPDGRANHSIYVKYVRQFKTSVFNKDVLRVNYRYFWDDWGITSHTLDLKYRYELGRGHYLQPHLRYYQQSEADFYRYFLRDNTDVLREASADYRLGDMTTTTIGLMYGLVLNEDSEFTLKFERMVQTGDGSPGEAIGQLRNQDLFPDVEAWIAQISYTFKF